MKNIGQMMKQAQQMQAKMAELQAALQEAEVTGESGGGLVSVVMTAKGVVRRLKIDPKVIDPAEAEMLEDLIVAAFQDAHTKADAHAAAEMSKLTGGLNLPAGLKLPF